MLSDIKEFCVFRNRNESTAFRTQSSNSPPCNPVNPVVMNCMLPAAKRWWSEHMMQSNVGLHVLLEAQKKLFFVQL